MLGTNCTDNGRESGLGKFLNAVSVEPETVVGYEFMADYRVHVKHAGGALYEKIPYFCLPALRPSACLPPMLSACHSARLIRCDSPSRRRRGVRLAQLCTVAYHRDASLLRRRS